MSPRYESVSNYGTERGGPFALYVSSYTLEQVRRRDVEIGKGKSIADPDKDMARNQNTIFSVLLYDCHADM